MNGSVKTARIAGAWYLAIALLYSFSMIYVDSTLFVSGDVEATVKNIQAAGLLFRLGFVSCLLGHICFLFLANQLYKLFKSVDEDVARLMLVFVGVGVAVAFLNRLNQMAAYLILNGEEYRAAFTPAQSQGIAYFLLRVQAFGAMMASLFWGLWLLPLGLLVVKSGFIPKALGILLICACVCYCADFFIYSFIPRFVAMWNTPRIIVETGAEVSFILWLLVVGVRKRKTLHGATGGTYGD